MSIAEDMGVVAFIFVAGVFVIWMLLCFIYWLDSKGL